MIKKVLLALAFTVAAVAPAAAEIHTHAGAKVSIDIPSSWKVGTDKNGLLVGRSADDAVGLLFWALDTSEAGKAFATLDKQVGGKLTDMKWPNKPQTWKKNGLSGFRNAGTAKFEGKDVLVIVGVAGGKKEKQGVIVFGAIDVAKGKEHKAELENIFASLKYVP